MGEHDKDLAKCHRLIRQVVQTWSPPLHDDPENRLATCVQTGFMGGLAIAMGGEFPWHELGHRQRLNDTSPNPRGSAGGYTNQRGDD